MNNEITLCERKPFASALFSPWGITMLLFAFITFGITFLVFLITYFGASPKRVWAREGRLYASRKLPADGVALNLVRLQVVRQSVMFVPANRYIRFYYSADNKNPFLGLNEIYYGKPQIDRAIAALSFPGPT
jgi:hypothetical protein